MGDLKTKHMDQNIVWGGHLCEGSRMVRHDPGTFLLWTRCRKHDVPANKGLTGNINDVDCAECLEIYSEENSQFGVGG